MTCSISSCGRSRAARGFCSKHYQRWLTHGDPLKTLIVHRQADRKSHGMTHSTVYNAWLAMVHRCTNPKARNYSDYGGRGIKVCDRWLDIHNFYADMGERPDGMTLERIDNNGNYEPGNCKWASNIEQQNNKRNNQYLTAGGKTQTITAWAKELGFSPKVLFDRNYAGWPTDKILNTPVGSR